MSSTTFHVTKELSDKDITYTFATEDTNFYAKSVVAEKYVNANELISNQVVPDPNDWDKLNLGNVPSFNLGDKYYYKDQTPRSRTNVYNQTDDIIDSVFRDENLATIEIYPNYRIKLKTNNNSIHSEYKKHHHHTNLEFVNQQYKNRLNTYMILNENPNDSSINQPGGIYDTSSNFLIDHDLSNVPTAPAWGPNILNQGQFGDCYAFSASTNISFAYSNYLKIISPSKPNNKLHNISNFMLPSMIYMEKLFNRVEATMNESSNPFNQSGSPIKTCYNYLIQDSHILEFQYTYPLLLTAGHVHSNKTNQYLINEFIDKVINDTPNDILAVAKAQQFYNDPGLQFKFHSVLTKNMVEGTDPNYNPTDISNNTQLSDKYYNIILNKTIELLNNNQSIVIGIPIATNPTDPSNTTFSIPDNDDDIEGGHAITIVGYDNKKQHYIIQNSWGLGCGINNTGFYYLPYSIIKFLLKSSGWSFAFTQWFSTEFYT